MKNLHGTGVALVTPFLPSGDIDFDSLKKLLQHTAQGVDYYVVMGTTGEAATLTLEEKKSVLDFVKKNNEKKLPIVYGIGSNNTHHVLDEMEQTDWAGVSAMLSASPYYNKPSQEGIYLHFRAINDHAKVPVLLYNVPGRTASNLTAATTLRLASLPNIIGIKEASGNMEQCMWIASKKPADFLLISGDDLLTLPIYSIGGVGVISVMANAFPIIFKNLKEAWETGKIEKAQKNQCAMLALNALLYEEGNPTGIKYVLSKLGVTLPHLRLPMTEAGIDLQNKINHALTQY